MTEHLLAFEGTTLPGGSNPDPGNGDYKHASFVDGDGFGLVEQQPPAEPVVKCQDWQGCTHDGFLQVLDWIRGAAGEVQVVPATGAWDNSPHYLGVTSAGASAIYYRMINTYDGTAPSIPSAPTPQSNDGVLDGPTDVFQLYGASGSLKRTKLRFVGCSGQVCGPASGAFDYAIDLRGAPPIVDCPAGSVVETAMGVGSVMRGRLDAEGRCTFRLSVAQTARYALFSRGNTNVKGTLYDASYACVSSNTNSGELGNFRIEADLSPGTYYLEVMGDTSSVVGGYQVHIEGPGA